jgi:hypothetical protein
MADQPWLSTRKGPPKRLRRDEDQPADSSSTASSSSSSLEGGIPSSLLPHLGWTKLSSHSNTRHERLSARRRAMRDRNDGDRRMKIMGYAIVSKSCGSLVPISFRVPYLYCQCSQCSYVLEWKISSLHSSTSSSYIIRQNQAVIRCGSKDDSFHRRAVVMVVEALVETAMMRTGVISHPHRCYCHPNRSIIRLWRKIRGESWQHRMHSLTNVLLVRRVGIVS